MKFLVNLDEYKIKEINSLDEFINGVSYVTYNFNFINGTSNEVSLKNVSDFIKAIRIEVTSVLYKLIDPDYIYYQNNCSELKSLLTYIESRNISRSVDGFVLEFSDYLFVGKLFSLKWSVYTDNLDERSYLLFSLIDSKTKVKDIFIKSVGKFSTHEMLKGYVFDFIEKINSKPSSVYESFDFHFKDNSFYCCLNYYYLMTMRTSWEFENSSKDSEYIDYLSDMIDKSNNVFDCVQNLLIKLQKNDE